MKLASGFCIPEPLPVHTGIKGWQVHPLIRFLLRSRVDEKCADLHKAVHLFICSWLASRCSQRSPSHQRFPWALQLKEQILKEQITDGCVFFKMPFRPCPSGCGRFLSADDGHDLCLQCLSFQHAEDAFVDDSCACCGRMSMTSLRSRLSFLKGLSPSAATRAGLSGSRTTGWRVGRSEGDRNSLSAGYVPTDLLLLTQRTSRPVPGWFRWSVPWGTQHFIQCAIQG